MDCGSSGSEVRYLVSEWLGDVVDVCDERVATHRRCNQRCKESSACRRTPDNVRSQLAPFVQLGALRCACSERRTPVHQAWREPIATDRDWFGRVSPAKPNSTIEGRDANRRVVLVILGTDDAVGGDPTTVAAAADQQSQLSIARSTDALRRGGAL